MIPLLLRRGEEPPFLFFTIFLFFVIVFFFSAARARGWNPPVAVTRPTTRDNVLNYVLRLTFEEETFVNVNNIKTQNLASQRANGIHNQYIVVTILLAIEGKYMLPSINSSPELKEALQKLSSINRKTSKNRLELVRAVEVLWTPQNETNTLLEEQLLKSYPHLKHF
ncbi:hypothetical protein RchiOBHm_Chr3g0451981 [Rosa chinensis]|uniref:Uncharacterized protein n=1 Tax=Rosa chinensis TaxID=74649 RepID=A0A2P6R689_ROSCH|nr:hypothetical protein RchiOBHm_Chr3g0451981 [Rosa chinensis]